ncbi:DUF397 domain-containing protein [Planobispora longispora]|uniref:Transcriptional regulator n=1 Tax=Planobispora longispora TaxID=28887 RepID=A0A8J3RUJ0_9ACTN|nr:DUF397 domain-containing protein [Planobispora longispora]BFE85542.1 DUF397 domain-containing protein [Planobispora longispora]GIH80421.1 transcriptional regulator [Planobispora longispora]
MNDVDLSGAIWRKSSRSNLGNCVEVARLSGGLIGVRDSKAPEDAALVFTPAEWDAFVAGVKDGEFDLQDDRLSFAADR